MNQKMLLVITVSLLAFPGLALAEEGKRSAFRQEKQEKIKAHREEQRAQNKEFRQTLKNMSPEERANAVKAHHAEQYVKNTAFRQKAYEENMARLKDKLANNPKLTDAQKSELINTFEKRHQENMSYRERCHNENTAFFERIANDVSLTPEQKKQAIQDYREKQKELSKQHWQQQRESGKVERERIKSESDRQEKI